LPKAAFAVNIDNSHLESKKVYFNNLSRGAIWYNWEFGDSAVSTAEFPVHQYKDFGIYNVRLIVKNSYSCSDTFLVSNEFLKLEKKIVFPTAFTPKLQGPISGFYSNTLSTNEIFYPSHKDIIEYNLKIQNRYGTLVFESNDINFGWNGYFRNKLLEQGVYSYSATGKFIDGSSFEFNGDVNLIVKDMHNFNPRQ
jgi:PKD repeat protein